jgi:GMP synthase-like glutamine amidotransferase
MAKEILIFRHFPTEGPGYLAEFLDRRGLRHRTIRIDAGEPVPESIADAAGLVFMGGPMSVNDPLPWIPKSLNLIRQAVAADRPVLGHCLGGQLMSKALGARVRSNRVKEIGWLPVECPDAGRESGWLNGLPGRFEVFHWHGETFGVPDGAALILRSRHCRNQGFTLGRSLALQCHIEMTPDMVRTWSRDGEREIAAAGPSSTVQRRAQMLTSLARRTDALHRVADTFYSRWIQGLRH